MIVVELARRFALTFGLDTNRTRDAVSELHKWGIEFALKVYPGENLPRYMSFLDVLTEFSTKLIKQDKPLIVGHLKRRLPQGVEPQEEEEYWTPFVTYRFKTPKNSFLKIQEHTCSKRRSTAQCSYSWRPKSHPDAPICSAGIAQSSATPFQYIGLVD
jgi:hypothetical protein